MDFVRNPINELLAIKLYEHDHSSGVYGGQIMRSNWLDVSIETRMHYRNMAGGSVRLFPSARSVEGEG